MNPKQQAIKLIKAGKTRREAAIYLGVTKAQVYHWTKGMKRNDSVRCRDVEPDGPPTEPIGDVSFQERLDAMRKRVENNEELYHPFDCPHIDPS